jgi:predicted nucleic acid-binding protein
MNLFLDTSSLFKLYHREKGTEELDELFKRKEVSSIYLSEISKIEFESVAWKKVRIKEIDTTHANGLISIFRKDYKKYIFIEDDSHVKELAKELLQKYGLSGLKTLDALQLATAVSLKEKIRLAKSSDISLLTFFEQENIKTK